MSIERVIGIDFGTSTSVVKIKTYKDNQPMEAREIADYVRFNNKDTLPTLVYKTNEGNYLVGYEAENAAVKGQLYQNFKLDLINENEEIKNEAVFYTTKFFEYMYKIYYEQRSHFPSCDFETTYVSYPAKWPDELRRLMIDIAIKVGFKNVIGIDEPTAAIHTVMIQNAKEFAAVYSDEINILMIDMGAGTTDIVLCKYDLDVKEKIKVLNTWPKIGDSCLFGGREIDERLCKYVKDYLIKCGLPNAKGFESKYLDKCKTWKEANISPTFKAEDGVVKYCGFIDTLLLMLDIDNDFPPIARSDFENMLEDYINQFSKMVNACIDDIDFDRENIDYVILTGGHSQWYFISDIIEAKLRKYGEVILPKIIADKNRIICLSRPQETVALGMVYQNLNTISKQYKSESNILIGTICRTLNEILDKKIKAKSDDWITYRNSLDNWKPYLINKDGSKNIKLPFDLYFNQAFTVDNENEIVYWTDAYKESINKLYLKTGKTEAIINPLNAGKSYSESLSTMERRVSLCVNGEYIYCLGRPKYAAYNECYLFKFKEGQKPMRLETGGIWSFCEYEGHLYFMQPSGDFKDLCRIKLSSNNGFDKVERICRMPKYPKNFFYIYNNYLYYSSGYSESVYKMKVDGTENQEIIRLPKDCNLYDYPYSIDFVNGWLKIEKMKFLKSIYYKVRLDGTDFQMI